jgi:hypothetical protein
MPVRRLDPDKYNAGKPVAADADADWNGNNAAFTCPVCSKVFVVSAFINTVGLRCPACGKSTAYVTGSPADKGTEARIEWKFEERSN